MLFAQHGQGEPIGIEAAPPHLAETVWRLPGETADELFARALDLTTGTGFVVALVLYASDLDGEPVH